MEISAADLAKTIPKVIEASAGGDSPEWLTKMQDIIKGINDMVGFYREISGKAPPANIVVDESHKMSFMEARELKKAEMAGAKGQSAANLPVAQPVNNEFEELLAGLIKAMATLERMGGKEKPIGQVIMALPFTLGQSKDFLETLYESKYGG